MSNEVKLSDGTMEILKNFSGINPGMILNQGNVIKTIAVSGHIFAEAEVSEEFPIEFGIGNLGQFIQALSLPNMAGAGLEFDSKYVDLIPESGDKIRYYKHENDCIVHIDKSIALPSKDFEFELLTSQLNSFLKTASILKSEEAVISVENGKLKMQADTTRKEGSHIYTLNLGDVVSDDVAISFDIKNFVILEDDYKVYVKKDFGMELESKTRKLRYIIACCWYGT